MNMTLTLNDFFCGCGGMGLGFRNAGFDILNAWDYDAFAVASYRENLGEHVAQADISEMKGPDVPYADVWSFGFPCQDLSIAGEQKGMIKGETRSGLFYEIIRLLGEVEQKPKIIVAENVKRLASVMPTLIAEYEGAGYRTHYRMFNSKNFGVAQSRDRYFVVGVRDDLAGTFNFLDEPGTDIPRLSEFLETGVDEKHFIEGDRSRNVIDEARERVEIKGHHACLTPERDKRQQGPRARSDDEPMFTLTAQDRHGVIVPAIEVVGRLNQSGLDMRKRVYSADGLSPTLTTSQGGDHQPKILIVEIINNPDGPDFRVRRLTPREYARLQGFPDGFRQVVSDSQFYKQCGNAVTVTVAEHVAKSIANFLNPSDPAEPGNAKEQMPTKKPTDKTPPNNAGSDVVDEPGRDQLDAAGEIRTFKSGGLPSIANVADDGPRTGAIADVAFFSGLFPGETPATLAIRILAGQSLGMDAAQALFDLETGPGPTVRYRPAGRTFEVAQDDVAEHKAALKEIADRTTSETASPPAGTPKPALAAVPDPAAGSNVVDMPGSAGSSQKIDDSANNGPTTKNDAISPAEDDQTPGRPDDASPLAGSDGSAGSETLNSALSTAGVAETVGDVGSETINAWRSSIVEMCAELGINQDEKTKTFDTAKLPDKRKMFDDARKYYFGKIETARRYVLDRLAEDGKTSTDAQKGFFLFADVPLDPSTWDLNNAKKAEAAIADFLKSKGSPADLPSPKATNVAEMVTAKQLGMIRAIAREAKVDADKECAILMNCAIDELSKRAASDLIERLQEMQRANSGPPPRRAS